LLHANRAVLDLGADALEQLSAAEALAEVAGNRPAADPPLGLEPGGVEPELLPDPSRPPVAGNLVGGVGAGGGQRRRGGVFAVDAQPALGGAPRDRVDAR
jgi:hypothetical protein